MTSLPPLPADPAQAGQPPCAQARGRRTALWLLAALVPLSALSLMIGGQSVIAIARGRIGVNDLLHDLVVHGPGSFLIVLITGLSGAGRSAAAAVLEDLGWYVVDNLPTSLLPARPLPTIPWTMKPVKPSYRPSKLTIALSNLFPPTSTDVMRLSRPSAPSRTTSLPSLLAPHPLSWQTGGIFSSHRQNSPSIYSTWPQTPPNHLHGKPSLGPTSSMPLPWAQLDAVSSSTPRPPSDARGTIAATTVSTLAHLSHTTDATKSSTHTPELSLSVMLSNFGTTTSQPRTYPQRTSSSMRYRPYITP